MPRLLTVVIAAIILASRIPHTVFAPQFWAEDGILFRDAYLHGFGSIFYEGAGYPIIATRSLAWLCTRVDPSLAPRLFVYAAVAVDLFVVWLITSPRFPFPHRPVAALAVVVVPQAFVVLGALANTQWVLSVGAAAVVLMKPSGSRLIFAAECAFIGIVGLTGPYPAILLPATLFLWWQADDTAVGKRLAAFAGILLASLIVVAVTALLHPASSFLITSTTSVLDQLAVTVHKAPYGARGAINIAVIAVLFVTLLIARMPPLAREKSFLWLVVALTLLAAMAKQRCDLATIVAFNHRYTYEPAIFLVWIACVHVRSEVIAAIGAAAVTVIVIDTRFEHPQIDFSWADYSTNLHGTLDPFPVAPGWIIR